MGIETITTEQMNAVKELASTNLKVSEARNLLFKLQEEETEYLVKREEKALAQISKVLEDSRDLLDKTHKNYEEIHQFCQVVSGYADFLGETHGKFQGMLEIFNKRNEIWEENVKKINTELASQRKIIEIDAKGIKEKESRIITEKENLAREKAHIESRQATLLKSYEVEKDLWTKIHSQKN